VLFLFSNISEDKSSGRNLIPYILKGKYKIILIENSAIKT
jgi:hypothetical protein